MKIANVNRPMQQQKGVVLWITLMIMIVLLGATLLIARNTAIGLGIEGNLAFKKNATALGDVGTEEALAWLKNQSGATLYKNNNSNGYFASWNALIDDPAKLSWKHAKEAASGHVSGYSVDYLIHRMCKVKGLPSAGLRYEEHPDGTRTALGAQECVYTASKEGSRMVGVTPLPPKVGKVFYRVTSRIKGPRNTVSYVQSMVY